MKWPALCLCAFSFFIFATCLSLAGGTGPGAVSTGDYLGKSKADITKTLVSRGYEVEEFENAGGLIDVEAAINGVPFEIHVDLNSGSIVGIEEDD